jgi:hypothetical protein
VEKKSMENPVIAIAVEDSNSTPFIPNNPRYSIGQFELTYIFLSSSIVT